MGSDALRLFERAERRKGLRHRTILDRTRTLERLAREHPLLEATTDDLEDWLDRQHITVRSRKAYLSHLSAFYGWCVLAGVRVDDPTRAIPAPRVPRLLPHPIDDNDLDVALRMADPRMRAWLCLGCFAGFRCMEIAQLERADVLDRRDPPLIRVADGKGGKPAVLPLHPQVLDALHAYGMPQSGPVFVSQRGRPFAPATVSGYIAAYLHGLGIPDSGHALRHFFGSALYSDTHDLRLVQEMLRHSDPSSTAGYTAFDAENAVAAVTRLHPRSTV